MVSAVNLGEQLCLSCGLCCDGTLFDGVQLEPGDDPARLKALGLPVWVARSKPFFARFPQPCAAFCQDRTCGIYVHRPAQCRSFECKLFKDAQAGRVEAVAAVQLIRKARQRADKERRLLRKLGDTDDERSLGERFHRMQCRMESTPTDEAARHTFADLSLAVHQLKLLAHDRFYTRQEAPAVVRGKGATMGEGC